MGKSWIEEFGIPDNPADFRRRQHSRDSFEVQASRRGLLFPRIVEDTAGSDKMPSRGWVFKAPVYPVMLSRDLYRSARTSGFHHFRPETHRFPF